jgi:hypothetical protein
MKTSFLVFAFSIFAIAAYCQYTPTPLQRREVPPPAQETEEPKTGFDVNKIFVGGSIGLGLGFGNVNSSWSVGAFPQIGYSITDWFDAGLVFNANYNSQKYNYSNATEKYTSFNYGTGAFVRAFPIKSFFVQAQPEINWIAYKIASTGQPTLKTTIEAPSLLLGLGFGQRLVGQSGFFTTIMIDVLSDPNSPYRAYGNGGILPVLRAGFYVYLGKKGQGGN